MPKVMPERHCLCQVFVKAQPAGNGAGNLRNLQRMRKPCAVVVALRRYENLRFMLKPAKRFGMYYFIAVALKFRAYIAQRTRNFAPLCIFRKGFIRRKRLPVNFLCSLTNIHTITPKNINRRNKTGRLHRNETVSARSALIISRRSTYRMPLPFLQAPRSGLPACFPDLLHLQATHSLWHRPLI